MPYQEKSVPLHLFKRTQNIIILGDMKKFYLFVSKFEALSTEVRINVYNKFCKFNLNGGTIYRMDELDEMFTGVAPTKLFEMTSEGFSINDRYFIITSFGL